MSVTEGVEKKNVKSFNDNQAPVGMSMDINADSTKIGTNGYGRYFFYVVRSLKVDCRDPQKAYNELKFKKQKDPYFTRPTRYNDIKGKMAKKKKQRANYFKRQNENKS